MMNLSSPLFDKVRIPRRETAAGIAERMCREAGFEPQAVRVGPLPGKGAPKGLHDLRCMIICALVDAGYVTGTWFEDIPRGTLLRYCVDGRRMQRESANA